MGRAGDAAAGALATLPMSAVLAAARAVGMPGPLPPVLLVRRVLPGVRPPYDAVAGAAAHLAIGAVCGALVGGALRRGRSGPLVGAALWAAGYCALMPLAGVLPPAWRDAPERQAPLFAAHLVFASVLRPLVRRS